MNDPVVSRLIFLFNELINIMSKYGFTDYLRTLGGMVAALSDESCSIEERINEVKSKYKRICGGAGSLTDWGVALADKEKQKKINKYLGDIFREIWGLLGGYEDALPGFIADLDNRAGYAGLKKYLHLVPRASVEKLIEFTLERSPSPDHIKKCTELRTLLDQRKE